MEPKLCFILCNIPVFESFILDIFTIGQQQKYTADCIVLVEYCEKQFLCALGRVIIYTGKWMPFCVAAAKFEARLFNSCSPFSSVLGNYIVWALLNAQLVDTLEA